MRAISTTRSGRNPTPIAQNAGGWRLIVAIADVAHYVRRGRRAGPGSAPARQLGLFPDRVVPMLPENLSNNLCSLRPEEDRACVAAHIWIDDRGTMRRHRFIRGLMRSAARLTYEQVQAARDGRVDEKTRPLMDERHRPALRGLSDALAEARKRRGTLDLDLPERQVILDNGRPGGAHRSRVRGLDSHRLIEEFMIAANVAAAETLEAQAPAGDVPRSRCSRCSEDRGTREFLETLGLSLAKGQVIRPRCLRASCEQAAGTPYAGWSTSWSCAARPRPFTARRISAISA